MRSVLKILLLPLAVFAAFGCGSSSSSVGSYVPLGGGVSRETLLARCLSDKGVKAYGSDDCEPCDQQLAAFGDAAESVPYVKCWDDTTFVVRSECDIKGVTQFPTWVFPDGNRLVGQFSLETIAAHAGCHYETPVDPPAAE